MTILNIYNSYYKHIPLDVLNAAVAADPTSYNQGEIVKVGNFVKWILKLYTNGSWKAGDSYETKDLLSKFIKYKSKLPIDKRDINRFNSIHDLYSLIQTLEGQGVKTQRDVKKEGAEVVYEDAKWKIVIPHTEEASCIYGANTRWCTAGRDRNMFKYYNDKGPLYISINKQNGDKYQFHFESGSFMDAEDKEISPKKIGLPEGAIGYYKTIGKEYYFIYDEVGKFYEGFVKVKLEGRGYNYINIKGELLWKEDKWFDDAYYFSNGFACIKIEGRGCNYINTKGELLWKEYKNYDYVGVFSNGYAKVGIKGRGWNFINTKGELVWKGDKWFDDAYYFSNGFACIKIEGRGWNFINTKGELLWKGKEWFDDAYYFSEGLAEVYKEGRGYNFINEQGELLWEKDEWFVNANDFYNEFARVEIEGRGWNWIDTNGELVWKEDKCFDGISNFYNGFAQVRLGDKYNFINEQGELLWSEYKNYDYVGVFSNGYARVEIEGRGCNFININGEYLWKEDKWFDYVNDFHEGFAVVYIDNKPYKLNIKGELIKN